VFVDVVVLQAGGSLLDAVALAASAALTSAELPKLRLIRGGEDGTQIDIDLDHEAEGGTPFPSPPVLVSFAHIGGAAVVDTSLEEEAVASSRVRVGINRGGSVCYIGTEAGRSGDGGMQPQALHAAVQSATSGIAEHLFKAVDAAVARKRAGGASGTGRSFLSVGKTPTLVDSSMRVG
jgi:exosome complex RNA-binding protein Rrp42 (RNase PH superfamily)